MAFEILQKIRYLANVYDITHFVNQDNLHILTTLDDFWSVNAITRSKWLHFTTAKLNADSCLAGWSLVVSFSNCCPMTHRSITRSSSGVFNDVHYAVEQTVKLFYARVNLRLYFRHPIKTSSNNHWLQDEGTRSSMLTHLELIPAPLYFGRRQHNKNTYLKEHQFNQILYWNMTFLFVPCIHIL